MTATPDLSVVVRNTIDAGVIAMTATATVGYYGWGHIRGDGDRDDRNYGRYGNDTYGWYGFGR